MIEVGHKAHTALKVMLFRKSFKMTAATNKEFSSGDINHIIMGESGRVWTFIWEGPAYFEAAFHLISSAVIVFYQIGWCGLLVLAYTFGSMLINHVRGKTESKIHEEQHEKSSKRHRYINESFNNIKTVKLFGWEPDFIEKVDTLFKEELEIENRSELRGKVYEIIEHMMNNSINLLVFGVYVWMGNTLTLSKVALTQTMLGQLRGRIGHSQHLYRQYFHVMESMDRLWSFYCAPEAQTALIDRKEVQQDDEYALRIKGNFSYGVCKKLEHHEKEKIWEKIRKREHKKKTKGMGRIRKAFSDWKQDKRYRPYITLKDRSMENMIALKDLDINIKKGAFTVIIGATGAGKSTLLNAMMGELIHIPDEMINEVGDRSRPIKDGEQRYIEDTLLNADFTGRSPITIHGSTSLCEQQPWIQNGKLRDNVLFGTPYEKRKYVETIMAC